MAVALQCDHLLESMVIWMQVCNTASIFFPLPFHTAKITKNIKFCSQNVLIPQTTFSQLSGKLTPAIDQITPIRQSIHVVQNAKNFCKFQCFVLKITASQDLFTFDFAIKLLIQVYKKFYYI